MAISNSNSSLTIEIFTLLVKDLHSPISREVAWEILSLGNAYRPVQEIDRLADLLQGLEPHRVLAFLVYLHDSGLIS